MDEGKFLMIVADGPLAGQFEMSMDRFEFPPPSQIPYQQVGDHLVPDPYGDFVFGLVRDDVDEEARIVTYHWIGAD